MRGTRIAASILAACYLAVLGAAPAGSAAAEGPANWAVLGDSYTAGIFAGDVTSDDGCLRTSRAYPVLAHAAARPDLTLRNVSCGSAETKDILQPQTPPGGFAPVAPQIEALDSTTEVVTIGIGGNSLGFGRIITTCVALGAFAPNGTPCTDQYGADVATGNIGSLEDTLDTVTAEYRDTLAAVRSAAPNAKIVTVGYPQITPVDSATCTYGDPQQFWTIALADLPFFRLVEERLNAAVRTATEDSASTFVDTYTATAGKDVCSDKSERFIEGLKDADGNWLYIHPNERGHAAEAPLIAAAVTS